MSLVELLVAAAILLILVILLGQMLTQASAGWRRSEAHKEQLQTARAVLTALETDLQAALVPLNRSDTASLQFFINQTSGDSPFVVPPEYRNRDAVFFQAPALSSAASDVAEIGYFVKWDSSDPQRPRAMMCRLFASSADPEYLIYSNPVMWLTADIIAKLTPAAADNVNPEHSYKGLLAENIVGLWITPLDPLGKPILQTGAGGAFDSRKGYTYGEGPNLITKPPCALPSAVKVGFVFVAPEYARRIGPAEQAEIMTRVKSAESATAFGDQAMTDPALKKIRAGVRAFNTTILLKNGE